MFKLLLRGLSEVIPNISFSRMGKVESIAGLKKITLDDCKIEIVYNVINAKLNFLSGIKVSQGELNMLLKVADCLKPEELQEEMINPKAKCEICKVLIAICERLTSFQSCIKHTKECTSF